MQGTSENRHSLKYINLLCRGASTSQQMEDQQHNAHDESEVNK